MPNWTSNRIYAKGEEADIRAFLDAVRSQDEIFDFNRIIPMPELLKRTGCGSPRKIGDLEVSSWFVVSEASDELPEQVRAFTPEEKAELTAIGHSNWYDWSVANWGTKWEPRFAQISVRRNGHVEIVFDTAWSAPVPVLRKMIAMFPKIKFVCRWMDEFDDRLVYLTDLEEDDQ